MAVMMAPVKYKYLALPSVILPLIYNAMEKK